MLDEKELKKLKKDYDVEVVGAVYVDFIVDTDGDWFANVFLCQDCETAYDADSTQVSTYSVDTDATDKAWQEAGHGKMSEIDWSDCEKIAIWWDGSNWNIQTIE